MSALLRVAACAREASRRAEKASAARGALSLAIREAAREGHTMREIAQAAGISHQRVAQILGK